MFQEKILAQLKLACGVQTSISDRTLETLAATLSATITEETQIAAAIEIQKPFLKELDGNINFVAAKAVKDIVPPIVPPTPPVIPQPDPAEPAWFTTFKTEQAQKVADIETKFTGIQKKEASDALMASAKEKFSKMYKISDSEKALFDKSIAIELSQNPNHADVDSLVAGIKSQYEDLRSAVGLGGVEPVGNNGGGGGDKKKPLMKMMTDQLIREGKLPAPAQQN